MGKRGNAKVLYHSSLPVLFGVKKYADALWEQVRSLLALILFFFFYGPPEVPRYLGSLEMFRPLRWAPEHRRS
jgi:hypothetical protein